MGDVSIAEDFSCAYQVDINTWRSHNAHLYAWAQSSCPLFTDTIDVSIGVYVDDIIDIIASFDEHTAQQLRTLLITSNTTLRNSMNDGGGFAMNDSKEECVPSIRSNKENFLFCTYDDVGRALHALKHLGGFYQDGDALTVELECRIRATNAGWVSLKGFWFKTVPCRLKRLQFIVRVLAVSINNIDTYVTSLGDLKQVTVKTTRMLR